MTQPTQAQIEAAKALIDDLLDASEDYERAVGTFQSQKACAKYHEKKDAVIAALTAAAKVPLTPEEISRTIPQIGITAAAEAGPCALEDTGKNRCVVKCEWYAAAAQKDKRPLLDRMKPFRATIEQAEILTKQEQDAIKSATIERCAQVAEWFRNVEKFTAEDVAAAIRAMKDQP